MQDCNRQAIDEDSVYGDGSRVVELCVGFGGCYAQLESLWDEDEVVVVATVTSVTL